MSAQLNLVPNGSFEDTVHCPTGSAELFNAKHFSSPSDATPDYFNSCSSILSSFSIPFNSFGYQIPHTGNAYAGFVTYGNGTNYREYIQTELLNILENGKLYLVEYYISLSDFSPLANNNFGVLFSNEFFYQNNFTTINSTDAIISNNLITDTLNWVNIRFLYQARGDEKFLLIGNFKDDDETDTILNSNSLNDNYYYIDDISVVKIDYQIPNVFTPNLDGINDLFYINTDVINARNLCIYNRWGVMVFNSIKNFYWDGRTTSGELCNAGTYYYIIQTETETFKGFLELIK